MALSYGEIKRCLAGQRLPVGFVDLDAFDRNLERVLDTIRPLGIPLRPATKSIRVPYLIKRLLAHPSGLVRGVMCYSAREAEYLASLGIDDFLLAYPAFQQPDLDSVANLASEGRRICMVVDAAEVLPRLGQTAREHSTQIDVCLCVDMSLKLAKGALHLGVRRSPLHSPAAVLDLARRVSDTPGLRFHGLMAYEAQVAGLGDNNPFDPGKNSIKSLIRAISSRELGERRATMVQLLKQAGLEPRLVNGGGSGSLDTTTPETGVTEVTAGSAFLKSHLFDYYKSPHMRALEPAGFFAVEVTRKPSAGFVTCAGGGYIASGPTTADKAPLPHLPLGLKLLNAEMAGEVQTPLAIPSGLRLERGDPVVFRHAKAGELAERFNEYLLIQHGKVLERVPTYRGERQCFL
ncbi:MAG: alanine racemase [Polyangiaceae bacterium]